MTELCLHILCAHFVRALILASPFLMGPGGVAEEFEGNGKWGALGEIRRAAVECQLGYVNDRGIKGRALTIAQGRHTQRPLHG